jgi:hypothetical protein
VGRYPRRHSPVKRAEAQLVSSILVQQLKSVALAQQPEGRAGGVEGLEHAAEPGLEKWMLRFQATAIYEYKPQL